MDAPTVKNLAWSRKFHQLVHEEQDVLEKLDALGDLGAQTGDRKIIDFAAPYKVIFQNTPRLWERKNWNEAIFLEKRRVVEKHRKKIMRAIESFSKSYTVDCSEVITDNPASTNPQRGIVWQWVEQFLNHFKKRGA